MTPAISLRPCTSACRQRGVALIIVLAFLVLLSGIVVAFFSRAISERQVSDSSANQMRGELFADGALATIVGDLKQEIAAGSRVPATPSPAPNTYLYYPKTSQTAVPAAAGRPATATALPNLIKRSARQQPFFGGSDYDTTNYPPSDRAAGVSTTTLSQNIRSWSAARWNRALLLPKQDPTSDTDFTPTTGTDGFTAPDWVLVARNGSNPKTWDTSLATSSNGSFVVGRYAYTIYDEGGLLDMNAAGYPTGATAAQTSGKGALGQADLTQLRDSNDQPLLKQSEIDALVGWRNYATAKPPAEFPNPAFDTTSATNYFKAVTANQKGFLTAANTDLYNSQSDRLFASRQELMKLILSGIASQSSSNAGKAERARLQNVLQYLSHFSRGLNQPSFAPDPDRPKIVQLASGGNDAYTGDNVLNPAFLEIRVPGAIGSTAFKRADGTDAVGGEPLVKKRFALSRLAWLTYKGPIADDNGVLSSDPDLQSIITSLENAGLTEAFLKLGGPANIYKYFGLSWVPDPRVPTLNVWVYSHQGDTPLTSANPPKASIKTLKGGANSVSGREPDFVELLAAAVNIGSIGKASATPNPSNVDGYQAQKDISTSAAIIQMAANIIDQYDADSYPTRVLYDDGSWSSIQEFRGIEDLPYIYRVRGALMKVQESTPAITSKQGTPRAGTVIPGKEGLGVAFQQLEIWNPHTWDPNASTTAPRPVSFRVTAVTAPPSLLDPPSPDPNAIMAQPENRYDNGWQVCPPSNSPLKSISLTQDTTALLFDIPATRRDLFREPTLLVKPHVPAGSNLRPGASNYLKTEAVLSPYMANDGIRNLVQSPFYTNNGATDDQTYLGIYLGAFPLLWNAKVNNVDSICNAFLVATPAGKQVTYRIQYEANPNTHTWVTYDEKFLSIVINTGANAPGTGGSRPNWIDPSYTIGNDNGRVFVDPRTSRLGSAACMWAYNGDRQGYEWAPTYSSWGAPFNAQQKAGAAAPTGNSTASLYTAGLANQYAAQQNALWTIRPDVYNGFKAWAYPSSLGFYPTGASGVVSSVTNNTVLFRPGMLSQNNPAAGTGGWSAAGGVVPHGGTNNKCFFADPDNVVRRGMAGYVRPTSTDAEQLPPLDGASKPLAASGEPQCVATSYSSTGVGTPISTEAPSRPIVLNRPFRSVAEMGCISSGTPWRNLDFSTPESGSAALLDVFSINDTDDTKALVAGKVDLNTRQAPVLQAILAGAYKDEFSTTSLLAAKGTASANNVATEFVRRTSDTTATLGSGSGPLRNVSELIGRWVSSVTAIGSSIDGSQSYAGFSGLAATTDVPKQDPPNLSYILSQDTSATGYSTQVAQRYRESTIRALSAVGQTRVWNLMIDLVTQTGRYPQMAKGLDQFIVESEQRRWVHLAIDRYTGEVIDQQVEIVTE